GHFTAIATGRSHAMAEAYRKKLGFSNMVSDGGYGITIEGKLRELHPLPYDKCLAVIQECKEKDIPWAVQADDSDTRLAPDDRFDRYTHDNYLKTKIVPGLDICRMPAIYKLYLAGRFPFEEGMASLRNVPYCRYHEKYLIVEPADKAAGIRKMIRMLGGDLRDVVVFGDGTNDLSMFSKEWTCVAMGNAVPALKEKADFVTKNAADDGIYYACRELDLLAER
ncbi:MAG: HAD hydrolase family protein, partial [Lachnospiraceae bacterium]